MRFAVLGPLAVSDGEATIAVRGDKLRRLLAVLLAARGRIVHRDALIEAVWGDADLADPANALQAKVSQLRRALRPLDGVAVRAEPPGYVLELPEDALDAEVFEREVAAARSALEADPDDAARRLEVALALWRGPALVEFADEPFARGLATHLAELRLAAQELQIEVDLARGRHRDVVPRLRELLAAHPLRERLTGLLMQALGRDGRQAEAIEAFQRTRDLLADELGVDPGPELVRQYEQLLRQEDQAPGPIDPQPRQSQGSHLRQPVASFVGRDADLERLGDLLTAARLVTLTGPGGVGKTRLGLEAAHRHHSRTGHPGWFVALDGLDRDELVADAVARTMGMAPDDQVSNSAAERVVAALQDQPALLVLDNCEHVLEGAADLARAVLAGAADVTVLCTSREPLGLHGETVWSVPSLSLPAEPDHANESDAVRLFIERARQSSRRFEVDVTTLGHVVTICRRLEGIPLAIELAAARVDAVPLPDLAGRLDDPALLTSRDRAAPDRHRTLRGVMDWSWRLLRDEERRLLARLGVFAGGWTLDAAERVCGGPHDNGDVVALLASLVDKSLVMPPGRGQYHLLEVVREYARERLAAAGEHEAVSDRHAGWIEALADELVPQLRREGQLEAMAALERQLPNLRAALGWLREHAPDRAARLAVACGWFWYLRDRHVEGRTWLSWASENPHAAGDVQAMATLWERFLALGQEPTTTMDADIQAALGQLRASGAPAGDIVFGHLVAANTASGLGHGDEAAELLTTARALARAHGDPADLAIADFLEARDHLTRGDTGQGAGLVDRAHDQFVEVGDRWGQVQCLIALVSTAETAGEHTRAADLARRGLELAHQLGLRELSAVLQTRLGAQLVRLGDLDAATAAVRDARETATTLGSRMLVAQADLVGADLATAAGDDDHAVALLERTLAWASDLGTPTAAAHVAARLAEVQEARGRSDLAREALERARHAATAAGDTVTAAALEQHLHTMTVPEPPAPAV